MRRLFEAFAQAEASTRTTYGENGSRAGDRRAVLPPDGGRYHRDQRLWRGSSVAVRLPAVVSDPALAAS